MSRSPRRIATLAAPRLVAGALAAAAAALIFVIPLRAITDGELDGNRHPGVVLLLMEVNGQPAFRCSGTLLSPTVLLTAGHCAGEPGEFSGMRVFTESDVDNGNNNYPFAGPNSGGFETVETVVNDDKESIGRNDPCWCGSGKKYKKCHGA